MGDRRYSELPDEVICQFAILLRGETKALKQASLVTSQWRGIFQETLFSDFRLQNSPPESQSSLQKLVSGGTAFDQSRLLSFIKAVRLGSGYGVVNTTGHSFHSCGVLDPEHIDILINMPNLVEIDFVSTCFQWEDLDDEKLKKLLQVLTSPQLRKLAFFYFPGGYFPLCLLLAAPNIPVLKLEDSVTYTLVNWSETQSSTWSAFKLKLQNIFSQLPTPFTAQEFDLDLKGLWIISNLLHFIDVNGTPWTNRVRSLKLNTINTFLVEPPIPSEIAGKLLLQLGAPLRELHLHIDQRFREVTADPSADNRLHPSLATALRNLDQLEVFDLSLTVNIPISGHNREEIVTSAMMWLISTLDYLPSAKITQLRLTCRLSLSKTLWDTTQEYRKCCATLSSALENRAIWERLDDNLCLNHRFPCLQHCTIRVAFLQESATLIYKDALEEADPDLVDQPFEGIDTPQCNARGIVVDVSKKWERWIHDRIW